MGKTSTKGKRLRILLTTKLDIITQTPGEDRGLQWDTLQEYAAATPKTQEKEQTTLGNKTGTSQVGAIS